MKKLSVFLLILTLIILCGCSQDSTFQIVATTLPVYDFTTALCDGSDLAVGRLITQSVSCLHDYTLQVDQMRMIESADVVVISGAGLEDFLDDALQSSHILVDASVNTHTHSAEYDHTHTEDTHGHHHDSDPHIWLSPENAKIMAKNIAADLSVIYPEYQEVFEGNLVSLLDNISELEAYGHRQLVNLTCRELITFHDGFAYFAESFDLHILEAVEEESGSEASAAEIIHLAELITSHALPAIFIETNGSDAGAGIIARETGAGIFALDMAMSGDSYFDALYHNIDTVKEALE